MEPQPAGPLPGGQICTDLDPEIERLYWRMRQCAARLEDVEVRLRGVGALHWESAAGRKFREYLAVRNLSLRTSQEQVAAAAWSVHRHAQATGEFRRNPLGS